MVSSTRCLAVLKQPARMSILTSAAIDWTLAMSSAVMKGEEITPRRRCMIAWLFSDNPASGRPKPEIKKYCYDLFRKYSGLPCDGLTWLDSKSYKFSFRFCWFHSRETGSVLSDAFQTFVFKLDNTKAIFDKFLELWRSAKEKSIEVYTVSLFVLV